jgi:hypothetical protein
MSNRPAANRPRSLTTGRTALAVLSAFLILGATGSALAQDQPWPKVPAPRPPAAKPKPPNRPAPVKPKPAPPAKKPPAEAEPPADEAAPPADEGAEPAPESPPAPEPPPVAADSPAPEAAPAAPAEPTEPDPGDATPGAEEGAADAAEPTEPAEPAEPEGADAPTPACPTAVAPARPKPPARPAGPPVPPLATGPDELEWVEGAAIPPGYEPDTRVRKGLLIGGLVTFGVAWLGSAAAASYFIEKDDQYSDRTFQVGDEEGEEYPAAAPLYVPVIGPFVAIGTMDPDKQVTAALVADGIVQIGGVAMALAGLIAQEKVLVRTESASVAVVPTVTTNGAGGVSLTGSF